MRKHFIDYMKGDKLIKLTVKNIETLQNMILPFEQKIFGGSDIQEKFDALEPSVQKLQKRDIMTEFANFEVFPNKIEVILSL